MMKIDDGSGDPRSSGKETSCAAPIMSLQSRVFLPRPSGPLVWSVEPDLEGARETLEARPCTTELLRM